MIKLQGTVLSRTVALIAAAGLLSVVVFAALLPMGRYVADEVQKTKNLRTSIQQVHELSTSGEQFRAVLAQLEGRDLGSQHFLKSEKPATAAAEIEQLLKVVVTRRGSTIVSTQALPAQSDEQMRSVSVKVNLRGDLPQISAVIHNIESSPTSLFVQNLSIQARNSAALRVGQERSWRNLDVQFELVGYLNDRRVR